MRAHKPIIIFIILLASVASVFASKQPAGPIVIVSSYNPDVKSINENIDSFLVKFSTHYEGITVKVENMNCRNLSEMNEWCPRLNSLLSKYYDGVRQPAAIVLLGAEASSAFFSIDNKNYKKTPVIVGMRSQNILLLPDHPIDDIPNWNPQSININDLSKEFNIVGGFTYEYDVVKNVQMVRRLFPDKKNILFLSDNSMGGISMRKHLEQDMQKFSDMKVTYLDGRSMTFQEVDQAISRADSTTLMFIGTWRIDRTEAYVLKNTTYALSQSNPKTPAFTLASVGLGHWPVGGYIPKYCNTGSILADILTQYFTTGQPAPIKTAAMEYVFDINKIQQFGIAEDKLPDTYRKINEPVSFFQQNKSIIIIVSSIFIVLLSLLLLAIYYLLLSNKLRKHLLARGEELMYERDMANKANLAKSNFIANMSHEIRTPLNAVLGFSQLLAEEEIPLTAEERHEYAGFIRSNSNMLLNLINDVLDLSKIDAGRMKYDIKKEDLTEICHFCVESAKTDISPEVEMRLDFPDKPLFINTDAQRMQQILFNLLSNAKKNTERGSIVVALEDSPSPGMLCVSVTDTGCGIPKEKAEDIFERFHKLDEFKQGTGLGLSIVHKIISDFGGSITLDTAYTTGARFLLTLPAELAAD